MTHKHHLRYLNALLLLPLLHACGDSNQDKETSAEQIEIGHEIASENLLPSNQSYQNTRTLGQQNTVRFRNLNNRTVTLSHLRETITDNGSRLFSVELLRFAPKETKELKVVWRTVKSLKYCLQDINSSDNRGKPHNLLGTDSGATGLYFTSSRFPEALIQYSTGGPQQGTNLLFAYTNKSDTKTAQNFPQTKFGSMTELVPALKSKFPVDMAGFSFNVQYRCVNAMQPDVMIDIYN